MSTATVLGGPTMWLELFKQTLHDQRKNWFWWALSLALYVLSLLAFYPSIKGDPSAAEIMNKLPESMKILFGTDLTSPAGYVGGKILSMMPALLSVYAALTGAGLIAGAEARGHLEFPLSHPISRRELLWGRTLALLVLTLGLGAVLFAATWVGGQLFQAPLAFGHVLQTVAFHTLGAWLFGALALAVGAATARSGLAASLGAGLGLLLMMLYSLTGQVKVLADLAWLNPWKYALGGAPLTHAAPLTPLLVCLLLGLALCALATPRFAGRDIGR